MVYSDTSLKNGILQTCELLLDFNDGDITGNSTLKAQFTNLLNNEAYNEVIAEILKNEGDYVWDDSSYTDFPTITKNLVDNQSDYALPASVSGGSQTTFLRLIKVMILDKAGRYQSLLPISQGSYDQPLETVFYTKGIPRGYRQLGSSLILYPAPDSTQVTLTAGLKIEFQRDKVEFVVADTTKTPGVPSIYHMLFPLIMCETWAAIKGMKQLSVITAKKLKFMQNLGWGIANRNKDLKQRILPASARRGSYA